MPSDDPIADVRVTATALAAASERGPQTPAPPSRAAAVIQRLRSALERVLRPQLSHQQAIDTQTVQLIHELANAASTELAQLRAELNRLRVQLGANARSTEELADRTRVTESLIDELTTALPAPPPPS